jgi:dTDP-4-dehydrorhamnose 3,5-epimerase-like enzyme
MTIARFPIKLLILNNKESEVCLKWNDENLGIIWNCKSPIVSENDAEGFSFSELKGLF